MEPARQQTKRFPEEHSAGGVVVKGDEVLVIVPKRRAASGAKVLALPKGHVDGEETPEQAARREVREEGGVDADLLESLGDVRYRYKRGGRLIDKRVSFFLFAYRSGSTDDHDHEIAEARWMALDEAASALTYRGERDMVSGALSKIRAGR
ncbi:MAG TPA: NUDIX domain-containing protein [Solirubrobacteraceae bacterium]|nr:NUDIX domain-containing protein [Solirubrobacteraceae bacterium]